MGCPYSTPALRTAKGYVANWVSLAAMQRSDCWKLGRSSWPSPEPSIRVLSTRPGVARIRAWCSLREAGGRGYFLATLVVQAIRSAAQAFNVTAKISGSNPKLAPLVFMAPRSAWWQCISEQGCRVACWLEIIRALAASKPARDCLFVAFSGHELGVLGTAAYIERRPDLIRRAHAWIFLGSSIGAPRQPNLIHASDEVLEG